VCLVRPAPPVEFLYELKIHRAFERSDKDNLVCLLATQNDRGSRRLLSRSVSWSRTTPRIDSQSTLRPPARLGIIGSIRSICLPRRGISASGKGSIISLRGDDSNETVPCCSQASLFHGCATAMIPISHSI